MALHPAHAQATQRCMSMSVQEMFDDIRFLVLKPEIIEWAKRNMIFDYSGAIYIEVVRPDLVYVEHYVTHKHQALRPELWDQESDGGYLYDNIDSHVVVAGRLFTVDSYPPFTQVAVPVDEDWEHVGGGDRDFFRTGRGVRTVDGQPWSPADFPGTLVPPRVE